MKCLVIGSGGREHALGWKIAKSPLVEEVYFLPGNAGTSEIGINIENISINDFEEIANFVEKNKIDFTVVGPEAPLVNGIVDFFNKKSLKIYGPNQYASQLEGSKAFAKDFMKRYNIPTASYETFTDYSSALEYLNSYPHEKVVVKASGLAAGKGAIVCEDKAQAKEAIKNIMLDKQFGDAGNTVVIEEFMEGEEASIFVISDGINYKILPSSQDHKRIGENDTGPNTGGMGAYTPAPIVTEAVLQKVKENIIEPTLKGLKSEGNLYKGTLYVGLMIKNNEPKVVEFNCRFGDPETQAVLFAIEEDIVPYLLAAIDGSLNTLPDINLQPDPTLCLVIASEGYPGKYEKNIPIILPEVNDSNTIIFHAGTKLLDGKLYSNGGRVLNIVAKATSYKLAQQKAIEIAEKIEMKNKYYRRDIGFRVINKYE